MVREEDFKKANNIVELYALARQLRAEGEDTVTVNAMMAKRKRELLQSVNRVTTLKKVIAKGAPSLPVSLIPVRLVDIHANRLVVGQDGVIEL